MRRVRRDKKSVNAGWTRCSRHSSRTLLTEFARNVAVIQARKAGATLRAIGDLLGLTKERVRQIVDGR